MEIRAKSPRLTRAVSSLLTGGSALTHPQAATGKPNIVMFMAHDTSWNDFGAHPDAGTTPFRGKKGSVYEGGWRAPGLVWCPGYIPAGVPYGETVPQIDCEPTLASMAGIARPTHPPKVGATGVD